MLQDIFTYQFFLFQTAKPISRYCRLKLDWILTAPRRPLIWTGVNTKKYMMEAALESGRLKLST